MLALWSAEALQSVKQIDTCHIHGETKCHTVTWNKTITPQWSCTQYSMNMHLQQSPWAHTHTTRSRAFMTRQGCSCSHKIEKACKCQRDGWLISCEVSTNWRIHWGHLESLAFRALDRILNFGHWLSKTLNLALAFGAFFVENCFYYILVNYF